jgi:transcriptional regulator with XRE-family HTH domain
MESMGRAESPPDVEADDVGAEGQDLRVHLKAFRRSHGLSRAEVARSAGLTRRELRGYERGRRGGIPESDLRSIAGSCGVDPEDLLAGAACDKPLGDDRSDGWDTEWLDTRIDEFLNSDELDPPHLEIQLMLWDRGSHIWPEPVDPWFPTVLQPTLFDGDAVSAEDTAIGDVASLPVPRRSVERTLREFSRVQVA